MRTAEAPVVRLDTPTGLTRADVATITPEDRARLAEWHVKVAGDDDGRPWWPLAVRRLPLDERVAMARDVVKAQAWERRERLRCERDVTYFVTGYGHIPNEESGMPDPFLAWPEQVETLEKLRDYRRVIVLKARQLGLTWLSLHFAAWHMALEPEAKRARVLGLSKHGGDASKLLERMRRVLALLPPFLRPVESSATRGSLTKLRLEGRGEMVSLAGTPQAARGETASLAIFDEFAFVKNRQAGPTWSSATPTLGRHGRAIVISTGNGPPEQPGDGQAFAQLWQRAKTGDPELGAVAIFLPTSTDPRRDESFYAEKRAEFLTDEDYWAEYPETEDQALIGKGGTKVYPPAGVNAAERLGAMLDAKLAEGTMPPPGYFDVGEGKGGYGLGLAFDWGLNMHGLLLWPLERGGFYVVREFVERSDDVEQMVPRVLDAVRDVGQPLAGEVYDAAEPQVNATFLSILRKQVPDLFWMPTNKIPFSEFKALGIDYLIRLFRHTGKGENEEAPTEAASVIAISQRCPVLLRQLRALQYADDDSGRVEKGDDHGPDALDAGVVPAAIRWRQERGGAA